VNGAGGVSGAQEQYLVARIQECLAADERTNELAVKVTIRGDEVYLTGPVAGERRRAAIRAVVAECMPHARVCDEMQGHGANEPTDVEDLR
jgi:hypothetical protein